MGVGGVVIVVVAGAGGVERVMAVIVGSGAGRAANELRRRSSRVSRRVTPCHRSDDRRRRTLRNSWETGSGDRATATDTEQLRLALRDYRELTERLLHL